MVIYQCTYIGIKKIHAHLLTVVFNSDIRLLHAQSSHLPRDVRRHDYDRVLRHRHARVHL